MIFIAREVLSKSSQNMTQFELFFVLLYKKSCRRWARVYSSGKLDCFINCCHYSSGNFKAIHVCAPRFDWNMTRICEEGAGSDLSQFEILNLNFGMNLIRFSQINELNHS